MNWLDNYIRKNDSGYFKSSFGGLFVSVGEDQFRHVKGDNSITELKEITCDEFIKVLLRIPSEKE